MPIVRLLKSFSTGKNVAGATRAATQSTKVVKPLVQTSWGQGHPYNQKTGYNYTGCVATAIAQVMKYHEWPVQGQGENEYSVSFDGTKKICQLCRISLRLGQYGVSLWLLLSLNSTTKRCRCIAYARLWLCC